LDKTERCAAGEGKGEGERKFNPFNVYAKIQHMKTITSPKKIIVGLSGGVDSAVSAYLLLQQGHDVEAVFMKNWEGDDTAEYCPAADDLADAQAVCDKLGIPLHTVNFANEYWLFPRRIPRRSHA
jgi:tRNA(Ile)-lysidine synthase TilS/MesJ